MKNFSIDLKASEKGERKKAVKYLRGKGISVIKMSIAKQNGFKHNYLSSYKTHNATYLCDFNYYKGNIGDKITLTLPRDWDKLVELVEEDSKAMKESCDSILFKAEERKKAIKILSDTQKKGVADLFGDLVSIPICPIPSFLWNINSEPINNNDEIRKLNQRVEILKEEAVLQNDLFEAEKVLLKAELQEITKKL